MPFFYALGGSLGGLDRLIEVEQPERLLKHRARSELVDDALKDDLTPKLRKLPEYADFRKFSKSHLSKLDQANLLAASRQLLSLCARHQAAAGRPKLVAEAGAVFQAVAAADEQRDQGAAATDTLILAPEADRAAVAKAQHRLKAQLELTYSIFDFSQAHVNKSGKVKAIEVAPWPHPRHSRSRRLWLPRDYLAPGARLAPTAPAAGAPRCCGPG